MVAFLVIKVHIPLDGVPEASLTEHNQLRETLVLD
jgi:hypothetical protein